MQETFSEEPGIRNSNLFPVNANGDVRLRSSLVSVFSPDSASGLESLPLIMASTTVLSLCPRYMEMIAGGASLPPSLWSLPAEDTEMRSNT